MTGLRLKRQTEARWVPLINGAALFCAAPTTPLVYAARSRAAALLAELADAGEAVTKVGARIDEMPDLSDPEIVESTRQALFLLSLAEMAASDWRNIGDDDGSEIDFDASLLAELFSNPNVADAFSRAYLADTSALVTEGNA